MIIRRMADPPVHVSLARSHPGSSSDVAGLRDLPVVGQLAGALVRGTLGCVGCGRGHCLGRWVVVVVGAVVGVVLGGWLAADIQGALPVAAPAIVSVVVVVVLVLSMFIIDYLCVSRLILFEKQCLCTEEEVIGKVTRERNVRWAGQNTKHIFKRIIGSGLLHRLLWVVSWVMG